MVDIYLDMRRDRLIAEAQAAYDSLRIEMDRASEGLAQAMAEKTTFETENSLVLDLQKEQYSLPQWAGLRTDLVNLEAQVAGLTATLEVVGRQLGTGGGGIGYPLQRHLRDAQPAARQSGRAGGGGRVEPPGQAGRLQRAERPDGENPGIGGNAGGPVECAGRPERPVRLVA